MASYAAQVRREKEAHPERFCPKCLWRRHVHTKYGMQPDGGTWVTVEGAQGFWLVPCPKHEEAK